MKKHLLFAAAFLAASAAPVLAHAFLQHASPGAGAVLSTPPKQVTLVFSEKLEPSFSGVSVSDGQGHDMEAGAPNFSEGTIIVILKPLSPGSYHVTWHAVSVDTHRTEGSYNFSVK